jgi:hypothetical protein
VLKAIGGFGSVALAVPLVLRFYVVQELLAALILFSIGCLVIALLGLELFFIDAIGRSLFRKLQVRHGAAPLLLTDHWSFERDSGENRPLF